MYWQKLSARKRAFLTSEIFPYNQLMLCPCLYFENWACKTSASMESPSTSSESMFRVDFYRKTVIEKFNLRQVTKDMGILISLEIHTSGFSLILDSGSLISFSWNRGFGSGCIPWATKRRRTDRGTATYFIRVCAKSLGLRLVARIKTKIISRLFPRQWPDY